MYWAGKTDEALQHTSLPWYVADPDSLKRTLGFSSIALTFSKCGKMGANKVAHYVCVASETASENDQLATKINGEKRAIYIAFKLSFLY